MMQQNRLAQETSPYLRQHADNPVDWHPWSEQALQLARTQNKPILLSIGYSACHWCHVMAHESFDDPDTAELMNRLFINIKVDREERPDLDKIYQLAHLALTQRSGGWPLTMFLSPDQTPFFGGTYFPNTPRHGMPAFKDVLKRVAQYLNDNPQDIAKQNDSLRNFFVTINQDTGEHGVLSVELLAHAANELLAQFDPRDGGFGDAPKFPHTSAIEYALLYGCLEDDARTRHMAVHTLEKMARGGIYDQLGGGFFRYSVDQSWNIPHFEKMLYDNALLLALYVQASSATNGAMLRRCAEETAGWVMREMQAPGGAYYSSLDADSEGVEGKFYSWDKNEIEQLLNSQEYAVCTARYGLENAANFEDVWHLHIDQDYDSIAKRFSHDIAHTETLLASAKAKLFSARQQRPAPGRDEKILCGWNGLMIKAMACTARHLDQPAYLQSAQQAADFIFQHFYTDGRLYAVHKDGLSKHAAYLDDYAYLLDALFELLQNHWDERYCQYAEQLADNLLKHFQEPQHGGFFFTADDHETLIHRPKSSADDATPAGAAIAAQALLRWGYLLGKPDYLEAAQHCLQAAAAGMQHAPLAHCGSLNVLTEQLQAPVMFVVRCDINKANAWRRHFNRRFHLHRYLIIVPNDAQPLPAALAIKKAQGELSAYVCRGHSCSAAIHHEHYLKEAFERH